MLAASIQINAVSQTTQYASENTGVAEATNTQSLERNNAANTAAAASAETVVTNAPEQQAELFVGQLDEVLRRAEADFATETVESNFSGILEKSDTDQATQQQEMPNFVALPDSVQYGQKPVEQNVDAEQWLQAMLGQQQLQLQTRDTTVSSDTTGETAIPVAINPNVQTAQKNSVASSINTQLDSGLNMEMLESSTTAVFDEASTNTNEKVQRQIATESSHRQSAIKAAVINQSTINNAMVNTSASVVDARANESINMSHTALATVTKLSVGETSVNEISSSAASSLLAVTGTDAAQRSTQLVSAAQNSSGIFNQDAKLGEQLLHTLRDNVQLQIQQKIQNATIRLDPPELGSLEIYLSHEGGRLHVQITASQADVARLIQQTSDRLRQELSGPQFTQVNIQTSAEGQSGQQQSRERQRYVSDEMILANEQVFVGNETQTMRTSDVLISV